MRDLASSLLPGENNVSHDIHFVLPVDSKQLTPTDWITLDFVNYANVSAPTGVLGGYGTPNISILGKKIFITNIALLPGTGISIGGIFATNPPSSASNQIVITISEDQSGTIIRNQGIVVPSDSGNFVTVSATVESQLSALSISGYTSPSSFTILTENDAVIGTAVSDLTGYFNFSLTALTPGAHTYRINSTDSINRSTTISVLNLFLLASTLTTVSGVLLSPTISADKSEIEPGDIITFSGQAKPSSQINIFLEAPLRTYTTTTDAEGEWSFTVSSNETLTFSEGQYQVYTLAQDNLGTQSIVSYTVNFRVGSPPDGNNPPPDCNISTGDLNCDGNTNLVDFSILLFHWMTDHKVADINSDGSVNLVDFSIQMFYFTR